MHIDTLDFFIENLIKDGPPNFSSKFEEYLSPIDRDKLKTAIEELQKVRLEQTDYTGKKRKEWQGHKNKRIGDCAERIVFLLFENSQLFSINKNTHSTTGEIDILISIRPFGATFPIFSATTHILIEIKGHEKTPKSEFVSEMIGNLQIHNTMFGLLFFHCKPTKLPLPFRQAISISAAKNFKIVPLGNKQYTSILTGETLLRVLTEQFTHCMAHTSKLSV